MVGCGAVSVPLAPPTRAGGPLASWTVTRAPLQEEGIVSDETASAAEQGEGVDDALLDLDPNDAIEVLGDPDTDTEVDPANDIDGEGYTPEDVPGAEPVDESMADLVIPSAEDDIVVDHGEEG